MPIYFAHGGTNIAFVTVNGLAKVRNIIPDSRISSVAEVANSIVFARKAKLEFGHIRVPWDERFRSRDVPEIDKRWGTSALPVQ